MSRAKSLLTLFWNDQSGFVLTAELVLVSTFLVLGLIVGLSAVQSALVGELNDVGDAIGSLNQSYSYQGFTGRKSAHDCGVKSFTAGSVYQDFRDECDADLAGHSLYGTDPLPEAEHPSRDRDDEKDKDERKRSDKKDKDDDDDDDDDEKDRKKKKDKDDDD